jgi:hypothetical protein
MAHYVSTSQKAVPSKNFMKTPRVFCPPGEAGSIRSVFQEFFFDSYSGTASGFR